MKDFKAHTTAAIIVAKNNIEQLQKENREENLIQNELFPPSQFSWKENGEKIDEELSRIFEELEKIQYSVDIKQYPQK